MTKRWVGAVVVGLLWVGDATVSRSSLEVGKAGTVAAAPAPITLVKALDVSNYTGTISSSQVATWKSYGYTHLIVGTQNSTIANQQLSKATAGGMTVDVYVYLYFSSSMTTQINHALAIASGHPVGRIWLDCEDTTSSYSKSTYISKISAAISACGSKPVGIYSGGWWWTPRIGASHPFHSYPLWYSNYDGNPSLSTWSYQHFGGWTSAAGKQFKGDATLAGADVDESVLNLVGGSPAPAPAPAPSPSPSPSPAPTTSSTKAEQCTAGTLNVRSGPGTGYAIIGTISAGQRYVSIAQSGGWYKIYFKNNTGWCYGGYLTTVTGVTGVKVNVSTLNVRTGPGTGYAIKGTDSSPQIYIRTGTSSGWNHYYYGGSTGWSSGGFMSSVGF